MAGDWIKIEHSTPDKPEVDRIAVRLGIDPNAAFGACMRFWMWADKQTTDGYDLNVTKALLNRVSCCDGFADALLEVGWLGEKKGKYFIPKFERHNGKSAKNRALSGERMARKRYAANVTKASPEKRREECIGIDVLDESVVKVRKADSFKDEVLKVFTHYQEFHKNWKSRGMNSKEAKLVKSRFAEGYSAADLCKAIDGCHKSPFNLGENDRGMKYLDLGLILRSSDHVSRFIEIADSEGEPVVSTKTQKNLRAAENWAARHAEKDTADATE